MEKVRVKCANCGMIYDIMLDDLSHGKPLDGECPNCKSNAFTKLPTVWRGNFSNKYY